MNGSSAVRIGLSEGQQLFDAGDEASRLYLVEDGCVEAEFVVPPRRASFRQTYTHGSPFILECGGRHVARCVARTDCRILSLDRNAFERSARDDGLVRSLLQDLHARELGLILRAMATDELVCRTERRPFKASSADRNFNIARVDDRAGIARAKFFAARLPREGNKRVSADPATVG
ncbi:MAG: cyclic nucleotide-binding domain-containing protein [Hyphomicrobiaceae bacterium]